MPTTTAPLRIRLPLDPYRFTAIQCRLQSGVPAHWRAQPLNVEVGIYQNGVWVDSLSNYVDINMAIHPGLNRAGASLVTKQVLVGAMTTPSEANWLANTAQHATFELSSAETNFDLTGATDNRLSFWWVFWANLSSGDTPPMGFTTPTVIESSAALSLGAVGASQPNFVVTTRQLLTIKGRSGSLYPLTVDESGAAPVLTIGDAL